MKTFFLKALGVYVAVALLLLACDTNKKQEGEAGDAPEHPATAVLKKVRYVIGDSVSIGLAGKAAVTEVKVDGIKTAVQGGDTLKFATVDMTTGWHKVVVSGAVDEGNNFSDTLNIELLSDLVPAQLSFEIIGSFPHQTSSFTEGLEFYKGELFEGTGQNGMSKLLKIDLQTGKTLKETSLDEKYFGEGITIVNDKIYQLTWQSGVCFRYNMDFTLDKTFTYYTQGWGMTHNDSTIIMSDGSSKLYFYNTEMVKTAEIDVYDNTGPVRQLNELEYVDGFVFANVFETTRIVKIDVKTGKIVAFLNMDAMVPVSVNAKKDVLNGIARLPSENALYLTGKNWPTLFKVRIKEASSKKSRLL